MKGRPKQNERIRQGWISVERFACKDWVFRSHFKQSKDLADLTDLGR